MEKAQESRFPYMPFYVDDWLSSDTIAAFTLEQQAAYLLLLLRQWKAPNGQIPKDEAVLASYTKLGPRWRKVGRPIVQQCFVERAEGFVNLKLRGIWLETKSKSAKAKASADRRWEIERQAKLADDNGSKGK